MQNSGKKVALITGANKGIGLQIAKDLAAHGFTVLVGSRNRDRGEEAAKCHRPRVDTHQGQCRVPGFHRDGPQQLSGDAHCPTGRTRTRAPRASRLERSDRHPLERGRPASMVTCLNRAQN